MTLPVTKRKQQKNPTTGLTRAREKQFKKEFTHGLIATAGILGVDRNTIARWCRQGLPHKRGAPGKEHQIELRTAIHWSIGHQAANKRGLELSALEKVLWSLAIEEAEGNERATLYKWKARMLNEFDWFDVTPDEINFSIGRLSGMEGCLPFPQRQW